MIALTLPTARFFGGVSGQAHLVASALVARGHQVTVFGLHPPHHDGGYSFQAVRAPRLVGANKWLAPYLVPLWVSGLDLNSFDVIHSHGDDHFVLTRRPLIRTFYGSALAESRHSVKLRHRFYHLSMVPFEWVSLHRATQVVAISRTTGRLLNRDVPVIPCTYDPGMFSVGGVKSAEPSVLFVGELDTRKRGNLLLGTFQKEVRSTIPSAELWMVTGRPVSAPGVRWLGRVENDELSQLYKRAWVFCLPSSYEGFGVPYLEAMASGTAVVGTFNGGAEEILGGGRYGLLAKDADLGQQLVRVLRDDSVRSTLVRLGRARASEYAVSRVAELYEALYNAVLISSR